MVTLIKQIEFGFSGYAATRVYGIGFFGTVAARQHFFLEAVQP